MYTAQSIDRVREADIVTVVSNYCQDLKKKGASYFCKSPFKDEKTGSFNVNPVKNNWVCYSTNQAGDGIKFVMLQEHVDFIQAVKLIAGICNIYLEEEKVSQEVKTKRKQTLTLTSLAANVAKKYQDNFTDLSTNHWAKEHINNLTYTQETLINFQIGFANDKNEITNGCIEKAMLTEAVEIGVTKQKDNRSYDFYRDRIIFPISNYNGDVVSFGGRRQNGAQFSKYAKYLNGAETELYKKEHTLYGFHLAKKSISKSGFAILSEGYTDVITMHQKNCPQTVATCGTALAQPQVKMLKRICEHVILFRDGDASGVKASIRDLDILLQHDFRVSIVPLEQNTDPDEFARGQIDVPTYISEHRIDAVEWYLHKLKKEAAEDIHAIAKIVSDTCNLLFSIKNEVIQQGYIKMAATILKQKQATFKHQLAELKIKRQEAFEKKTGGKAVTKDTLGLPEGADHEQYLRDRFCIIGNQYWFTKGDGWFPGTQYRLTPIAHIQGKKENKRLCEVINIHNQKKLIDFDSVAMINMSEFKKFLINAGVFHFLAGSTTQHFDLITQKILKEFFTALELQNLGWNSQGFFAFANSIYWKGKLQEVNKYGIIQLEGIDTSEEDEYNEKVEFYYSPAYSAMHIKNQDGDDPYENDRKFIYKKSPITLDVWMDKMLAVYGEKAIIGILFNAAACFRDLFLKNLDFFPLLGCFGEKGSGKSAFAKVLQNFFFFGLDALELNTSTLVAISRRLSRSKNTVIFLDEYNDKIDPKIFQAMKGAHQGLGREKGIASQDNRTKTDKIHSAVVYAGQYLPTIDDNSLQERTISVQFPKKPFSMNKREVFSDFKKLTEKGMSSLILEFVKHRSLVEDSLSRNYIAVINDLKLLLKETPYIERVFGNYAVLLVAYKCLEDRIKFPFSYETVLNQFVACIIENSESIQDSDGLTEFWNILQWLYEHKMIFTDVQFSIDSPFNVKTQKNNKESNVWKNDKNEQVLFIRLGSVHQDYLKECTKREGVQPIGETTLRNYFKSRSYYIGAVKGKRFDHGVSSCYAFNYTAMKANNIVMLDPLKIFKTDDLPSGEGENKDFPF